MAPHEAAAAHCKAVGDHLRQRIAALWPSLAQGQRAAIGAQTDTDGMTALLETYDADLARAYVASSPDRQLQLLRDAGRTSPRTCSALRRCRP